MLTVLHESREPVSLATIVHVLGLLAYVAARVQQRLFIFPAETILEKLLNGNEEAPPVVKRGNLGTQVRERDPAAVLLSLVQDHNLVRVEVN